MHLYTYGNGVCLVLVISTPFPTEWNDLIREQFLPKTNNRVKIDIIFGLLLKNQTHFRFFCPLNKNVACNLEYTHFRIIEGKRRRLSHVSQMSSRVCERIKWSINSSKLTPSTTDQDGMRYIYLYIWFK